jgi:hypothetical protein
LEKLLPKPQFFVYGTGSLAIVLGTAMAIRGLF